MPCELDLTFYPVVFIYMAEPFSDDELGAYMAQVDRLTRDALRQNKKFVVIARQTQSMSAAARRRIAAAHAKISREQSEMTAVTYVIAPNAIQRGIITALRWLMPDTMRSVRAVPSSGVALSDALAMLEKLGNPFLGDMARLRAAL